MAESRFDQCLSAVLEHEGGYADHPSDPGGATNMGITHKTLARWRRVSPWWSLPKAEVKALGREEAARIYRAHYWNPIKADLLPRGLDLAAFDLAVNSGPDRAIRMLQAVLGVAADGQVGVLTIEAARKAGAGAIGPLCDRRLGFLRALKTFPVFGRGWTRRVETIRRAALAAAPHIPIQPKRSSPMDKLAGYRTYIVSAFMLLAGLAQLAGIDLPALDGGSAGNMIFESLAVIFLRKGLKGDLARS